MNEKPIIFSTPMVKAILDGRKTVTRRVCKDQTAKQYLYVNNCKQFPSTHGEGYTGWAKDCGLSFLIPTKSLYQKGDLLWVRETWKPTRSQISPTSYVRYKADDSRRCVCHKIEGLATDKWRPSIFMPKWAARIWLEVLNVRPERLQEITNEDAIAEGIERLFKPEDIGKPGITDLGGWRNYLWHGCAKGRLMEEWQWQYSDYSLEKPDAAKLSFSSLWQSINAKRGYGWGSNPYVWRIEFKRIEHAKN